MKNKKMLVMLAGFFLYAAAGRTFAQGKAGEEQKVQTAARELNEKHPEGQQLVADRIKAEFKVDEALMLGLHFRKMSNGEIAIALGLAQEMRRGITDKNLHEVVSMHDAAPEAGWGKVAKDLGVKLGPVIGKLKKIAAEVRRQEKADSAKKLKEEKAEKLKKAEKNGQPGKTEKAGMKSLSRP
jgi:hypothetical protein